MTDRTAGIVPDGCLNTIFSQGDSSDAVFYIKEGKIKLTVVSEIGKEATLRFSKSFDLSAAIEGRKECLGIELAEFLGCYGCHDWSPFWSYECARQMPMR